MEKIWPSSQTNGRVPFERESDLPPGRAAASSGHGSDSPVTPNQQLLAPHFPGDTEQIPNEESLGALTLGSRHPQSGRLVLSTQRTLPTAHAYVQSFHSHPDGQTLYCQAGELLEWRNNRYWVIEDNAVRNKLQTWLHQALRFAARRKTDKLELVDFESNPTTVKAALDSIRSLTHLDSQISSPSWLNPTPADPSPTDLVPCRTGLLHLPTMRQLPATPRFFSVNSLDFDPDPQAPLPENWYQFLLQLFDGDVESIELLQEWFGYCLTGDTSQQKMLLMVGPKRSGKGTIARVLTRLIGMGNVGGPTISSLAGPFGLQPLVGKSLAIVSDAAFTETASRRWWNDCSASVARIS